MSSSADKASAKTGINKNRIGRFVAHCGPWDVDYLCAAQTGCAVVRCEHLPWVNGYDVVAMHPDFDEIDKMGSIPEYHCLVERHSDGSLTRKFERKLKGGEINAHR